MTTVTCRRTLYFGSSANAAGATWQIEVVMPGLAEPLLTPGELVTIRGRTDSSFPYDQRDVGGQLVSSAAECCSRVSVTCRK